MSFKATKPKFRKTQKHLATHEKLKFSVILHAAGKQGVSALSEATPKDTSETANSWYYEIREEKGVFKLIFKNSVMINDVPLVVLLQYGHGTKNGGYVIGSDFINPALEGVFKNLRSRLSAEVRTHG